MTTLQELLDNNHKFDSLYDGSLSNHMPMALVALSKMNASEETLSSFYERYKSRLTPARPSTRLDDWKSALGTRHAGWFDFFREQIAMRGTLAVLNAFVPTLQNGIGAAAFHGLIRTAYALEAQHDNELAAGLASWAEAYWPVPDYGFVRVKKSLEAIAAAPLPIPDEPLIDLRLQATLKNKDFAPLLVEGTHENLHDLAVCAGRVYIGSRQHFTALHMVTATHALAVLNAQQPVATKAFSVAMVAASSLCGSPSIDVQWPTPTRSFESLSEGAAESQDDHKIKFIYSCWALTKLYDDGRFRGLAQMNLEHEGE